MNATIFESSISYIVYATLFEFLFVNYSSSVVDYSISTALFSHLNSFLDIERVPTIICLVKPIIISSEQDIPTKYRIEVGWNFLAPFRDNTLAPSLKTNLEQFCAQLP